MKAQTSLSANYSLYIFTTSTLHACPKNGFKVGRYTKIVKLRDFRQFWTTLTANLAHLIMSMEGNIEHVGPLRIG